MPSARKSFKEKILDASGSPSSVYISVNTPALEEFAGVDRSETVDPKQIRHRTIKKAPEVERKSSRVQVLLKPSIHKGLKEIAAQENMSVNELINVLLAEDVQQLLNP